jgi:hypothetical protein
MLCSSLLTLVVREAADALALVDSGKDLDQIIAAHDHWPSKFPLLRRHCTLREVEKISRREGQVSEDLCRVVLKHALFGERLLEAVSVSYREGFSFGGSYGGTKCKWISKEEASGLSPLRSLWQSHFQSSPPSQSLP